MSGNTTNLWVSLLSTMIALALVLALAWSFLRLLKRSTRLRSAAGHLAPQVVQAVSLGARERVVVLHHGSHKYLLGVTATQINLLDKQPLIAGAAEPTLLDP